jgi:CheY-like chemotaxis protein
MDNIENIANWDVLIVDDEPDSAGVVEHIFHFHDSMVRVAYSGSICLELLDERKPTLVFLDIQMPRMSGWEVLKQIRERELLKDLPVIALTAHVMDGDRERILAAGFDGYIAKPLSPLRFVKEVQLILSMREKHVTN